MSDEFQSGVCSGNWWNSSPRNGLHASGSVPCSTSISEIGGFTGWSSEVVDMRVRSCEESVSVSDSSMVFQDNQKPQGSDSVSGGGGGGGSGGSNNNNMLMDSTLQMMGYGLSTPTMDWNQGLLNRNSAGRADGNFHSMIQEELSSRPSYLQENFSTNSGDSSVAFNKLNQGLSLENNRLNLGNSSETCQSLPSSFSMDSPVQYGFQTPYLQGLFEPELAPQPSAAYENRMVNNYSSQPGYAMASNELPHSWQKLPKQEANTNQLHFSNNTPFWNPSASATLRPNVLPPVQNQIFAQTFEDKSNCSNYTLKPKAEVRDSLKKPSSEPPLKRARVETPSPLPTFKVRKEKLGDRVTALQQLVSPFGKTDTASVLFEAIEYIKFLHEQVSVLSAPYMKNGAPIQHQQGGDKSKDGEGPQQDLRSRGLCLVPMQSIFPVTNETTADFWTPTFGGTYR